MTPATADLRYPIGKFQRPESITPETRAAYIADIAALPNNLTTAICGFTDEQFDTPYRDGGWTVRQVVHHLADSHVNAYARLRHALTEDEPLIKTYQEALWAELPDARTEPPTVSLLLLEALHRRWTVLLNSIEPAAFARVARHPENGPMTVDILTALYAWHSRHHVAHINNLAARLNWR